MNTDGFTHESQGSVTVEWYTPPWIFERIGITFDLDPCHPKTIIPWVPAKKTFNIHDDGLSCKWTGKVWLNPPYGKFTKLWLAKMHAHRNGIALVFSRTDCQWFHDYIVKADAVLFLRKRIKFVDGTGATGNSGAGSGSLMAAWGQRNVAALAAMQDCGHFVLNEKHHEDDEL